jgi:hypothetical protein
MLRCPVQEPFRRSVCPRTFRSGNFSAGWPWKRDAGTQSGSQRPQDPGDVWHPQATVIPGHGHAWRHQATLSLAVRSPSKQLVAGSIPARRPCKSAPLSRAAHPGMIRGSRVRSIRSSATGTTTSAPAAATCITPPRSATVAASTTAPATRTAVPRRREAKRLAARYGTLTQRSFPMRRRSSAR